MLSKWHWLWAQLTTTLWIRACLFGVFGFIAALVGSFADQFDAFEAPYDISQETVDHILEILANSMLMVTTFSLSVMVSAYMAATSQVTPRATKLIRQDVTTQNVLATFIGSFIFSLVGLIAINTEVYQENGRLVLFAFTLVMIALILIAIFRWIEHLTLLGRVGATSKKVEDATHKALQFYRKNPCLGGRLRDPNRQAASDAAQVLAGQVGYIQHIDIESLENCAEALDADILIEVMPGTMVHPTTVLLSVEAQPSPTQQQALLKAFVIKPERSFEQDPRFGLCVLTEIAQRALSPAVNDPGTAIDIITRHVRVLAPWRDLDSYDLDDALCPRVYMPPLDLDSLFEDAFIPIARDAGDMLEVHIRLHKGLKALAAQDSPELYRAAQKSSEYCLEYALNGLHLEKDKERLYRIVNPA